jgi:hypothetical protein
MVKLIKGGFMRIENGQLKEGMFVEFRRHERAGSERGMVKKVNRFGKADMSYVVVNKENKEFTVHDYDICEIVIYE